ncbi:MAG: arsenic transporter, partial [Clostridia bacterium]|nr:arsenic transporter [Clostridia bacterium]
IAVAKKIDVSPVPVIIAIAVSSNLQGAATLVGDTTSIMLASSSYADMSFSDFFFMDGRFSIFWAVETGALLTVPILLIIFRKDGKKIRIAEGGAEVKTYFPTVMLLLNFALLIAASFIPDKIEETNGIICISVGIAGLIYDSVRNGKNPVKTVAKAVDYDTVLFLIFLFITIGNVEIAGLIDDISSAFASLGTGNVLLLYTVITFGAVLFSAFIDNIPFVATMLPVISGISASLSLSSAHTRLLYFGLLCGATLGGNLTPVGASANVVGIGILRKEGYEVTNKDFFKIGLPFTFAAVTGGYVFLYLVWGL